MSLCPLQDMDEARNHPSPQTNTGTENQTLHILTWTQGGEHHTPDSVRGWVEKALREIPNTCSA